MLDYSIQVFKDDRNMKELYENFQKAFDMLDYVLSRAVMSPRKQYVLGWVMVW